MADHFNIIPGRSVGPFHLGKNRLEIEAMDIRPSIKLENSLGRYYPMVAMREKELSLKSFPRPGINVFFDDDERCRKLEAVFSYDKTPPIFALFGEVVNGMTVARVMEILKARYDDVKQGYGSIRSTSAGIKAIAYEATDQHIMSIVVFPVKREESLDRDGPE